MTEIVFYHLTESRMEDALPSLVEKCRERDWNVIVEAERVETSQSLDQHLWSYRPESFLPHAIASGDETENAAQPILLTHNVEIVAQNPNTAQARFCIGGAEPLGTDAAGAKIIEPFERVMILFDGDDEDAVAKARDHWKALKALGHGISYWQQEDGRWAKKA
ncbi:MAG: DNA polymerase III subunit chi [Pseudomonadota bacterium]